MNIEKTLNNDIQEVLEKINTKIETIDQELTVIDSIVTADLNLLINQHLEKHSSKQTRNINFTEFRNKHLPLLKEKKKQSLQKAREKLEKLKMEILGVSGGLEVNRV